MTPIQKAAAAMGKKGGSRNTPAQKAARVANGKVSMGRPRKPWVIVIGDYQLSTHETWADAEKACRALPPPRVFKR